MNTLLSNPEEPVTSQSSLQSHPFPIRKILAPLDCGARSHVLLERAASLAHELGAELFLLHVFEPMAYAPAHTTPEQLSRSQGALHKFAESRLHDAVADCPRELNLESAHLIVAEGSLERTICEVARDIAADLLIVSTHGYHGIERLFLGSKAEWIVCHSRCPVMVVPVREED